MGALAYAIQLLGVVPSLITAGVQIKDLIDHGLSTMTTMQNEKRDPTPAEWDDLNARIAALRKELHS